MTVSESCGTRLPEAFENAGGGSWETGSMDTIPAYAVSDDPLWIAERGEWDRVLVFEVRSPLRWLFLSRQNACF